MSTVIRPELSQKNKYWIEKHRYYELKHFCLQYPIWKKARASLNSMKAVVLDSAAFSGNGKFSDPTAKCAEARIFYSDRIAMIEKVAAKTDSELSNYILKAVTEGMSYDYLKLRLEIPCCKDTYYELYRKFFWLLSQERE